MIVDERRKRERGRFWVKWGKCRKYVICIMAGVLFSAAAGGMDSEKTDIKKGILKRNPNGQGEAAYEIYVKGLEENEVPVTVLVPEQQLTAEQIKAVLPEALKLLYERMRGKNESLLNVTEDLRLDKEIPEYGLTVKWESESPEWINNMGILETTGIPKEGKTVYLIAELSGGEYKEYVEIPVTIFPKALNTTERFQKLLEEAAVLSVTEENIRLPEEFEGNRLSYRSQKEGDNQKLIFLGILSAGCLALKERNDRENVKKRREESLICDYPELVSRFVVLIGAGYPVKQVWKKQVEDHRDFMGSSKKKEHPLYEEMQITLNQMETGMPEVLAYREFGRRMGLRCYVKFSSLLESCVHNGGKDLRRLLEEEMETAFRQRTDLARRKGEEASTKLLFPMFLILGVVMVMIVAPAFLTLG